MEKVNETNETLDKQIKSVLAEYNGQNTIEKKELDKLIKLCANKLDINFSDDEVKKLESKYSLVVANTMKIEDIKPLISSIFDAIEKTNQIKIEKENNIKSGEITPGDIVSVPLGNKILAGLVKKIDKDNIVIDNYTQNEITIPNNKLVYKFFPGQKYDIRELNLSKSGEQKTFKEKLDMFLAKTNIGSYNNFVSKFKGDLVKLLKGDLTNTLISGNSIVTAEDGTKGVVNWQCKLQLYRNAEGNLALDPQFKQEKINYKVYGIELTKQEIEKTMDKKQSVVLERSNKQTGEIFKCFCKFDKDLNSFVTSQYSEKIEEIMKNAYVKKETEAQDQGQNQPKKNIFAQKNEAAAKEEKKKNNGLKR